MIGGEMLRALLAVAAVVGLYGVGAAVRGARRRREWKAEIDREMAAWQRLREE